MLKVLSIAGWAPALYAMTWIVTFGRFASFNKAFQLPAHYLWTAHHAVQYRLIEYYVETQSRIAGQ